jgi:hypothetical protein
LRELFISESLLIALPAMASVEIKEMLKNIKRKIYEDALMWDM